MHAAFARCAACLPSLPRPSHRRVPCRPGIFVFGVLLTVALAGCGGAPPAPPQQAGEEAPAPPAPGAPGSATAGGPAGAPGSISGVVRFAGTAPAPAPVSVTKDREVCGLHPIVSEDLLVGPEGGVQNAVVTLLEAPKTGAMPQGPFELRQKGCVFRPHVSLLPARAALAVYNDDGVLHNIHTFSTLNPPFNKAQPKYLKRIDVSFEKPETIRLACDAHPWMAAWLVVTDTPHAALSDAAGRFRLDGVPAGAYTAHLWHEKLGEQKQPVEVKAGESTDLSMELR